MPMKCLSTDLSVVFGSSDFGETVTWKGIDIEDVIFDDEDVEIQLGEGVTELAHQAVICGPSLSFPDLAENDQVSARGKDYRVKFWKDDGTGVIEIFLEQV